MISANRIQDPLDRLATVAERYMDFLEREARANDADKEKRDEWLTPKEASVLLRLHVQTVQEFCREGKLDAVRIGGNKVNGKGGKFLIPRAAIDAYIAQQRLIHGSQKAGAK
jgi:excisionase family DNA binding protein